VYYIESPMFANKLMVICTSNTTVHTWCEVIYDSIGIIDVKMYKIYVAKSLYV